MFISQIGSQKAILGMVSDITPLKMVLERMGEFRSEVNVTIRKTVLFWSLNRTGEFRLASEIFWVRNMWCLMWRAGSGLRFISESFEPVDAIILDGKAPGIGGAEFFPMSKNIIVFRDPCCFDRRQGNGRSGWIHLRPIPIRRSALRPEFSVEEVVINPRGVVQYAGTR